MNSHFRVSSENCLSELNSPGNADEACRNALGTGVSKFPEELRSVLAKSFPDRAT